MNIMQTNFIRLFTVIGLLALSAPVEALIIRDQCNQTSGDGQGHTCPNANDLLIRPKYSDGTCGDWICCPPNGDGTYNCTKGTNPSNSAISGTLKNLLGPRATVLDQGTRPGTKNATIFNKQNAPILRRGLDGDQPASSEKEGK
ncbi:MAG: hypothetical protein ABI618_16320 [Nitrospirota bacterium]